MRSWIDINELFKSRSSELWRSVELRFVIFSKILPKFNRNISIHLVQFSQRNCDVAVAKKLCKTTIEMFFSKKE